jgi:hypothetical protein
MAVGTSVPPASGLAGGELWLVEHACARATPVGGARVAGNGRGSAGHECGRSARRRVGSSGKGRSSDPTPKGG